MFVKGMLVECIEDRDLPQIPQLDTEFIPWEGILKKGAIYTVARSGIDPADGMKTVFLYEIPRRSRHDTGFYAFRFRPLQDSKLDVFRAMLVQTPAPVFVHNGDEGA